MSAAPKMDATNAAPALEHDGPRPSREVLRSRRKREVRAHTISIKRMTKRELEIGRLLYPADEHDDVARPKTRAECIDGERPCPFVSCAHHLYLDVAAKTGAIKVNFPDVDVDALEQLPETCSLDVADRRGATLEEVGAIMNLTRDRIRQVEVKALAKVAAELETRGLRDLVDGGAISKRRLPVLVENDDEQPDEGDARGDGEPDGGTDFDAEVFASEALDSE